MAKGRSAGFALATIVVLSAVAGFVDAACFLALAQVFTAHVTGNFAALASAIVKPDETTGLRLTVIAAFAAGVASAVCIARVASARDARTPVQVRRAVIRFECALLVLLLVSHAMLHDGLAGRYAIAVWAGMAMGCQTALSKLPGELAIGPPTTVMTSNFAAWIAALVERAMRRANDRRSDALTQLSLQLLLFVLGAIAGAAGLHRFGIAAIGLPLVLLMVPAFVVPTTDRA